MQNKMRMTTTARTSLRITPGVQLALKFLQAPALELRTWINQEILTNPILELEEEEEAVTELEPTSGAEIDSGESPTEADSQAEPELPDWAEFVPTDGEPALPRGIRENRPAVGGFAGEQASTPSLEDRLIEQLHLIEIEPGVLALAEYLVGCIDDRGYLAVSLEEIESESSARLEDLASALAAVQQLDPPGIGARDLRECLLLQLEQSGRRGSLAWRVVEEQFEDLSHRRSTEMSRSLHVESKELEAAIDEIRALEAHPGIQVVPEQTRYVVPDLEIERVGGRFEVYPCDRSLPRLRVNPSYRDLLAEAVSETVPVESEEDIENQIELCSEVDPLAPAPATVPVDNSKAAEPQSSDAGNSVSQGEPIGPGEPDASPDGTEPEESVETYLRDKVRSARWLLQALDRRRETMLRVMRAIVEEQAPFFERGTAMLKPLTLQTIARRVGMHESTVARVTKDKYVQTPQGILPLKFFFSTRISTQLGEDVSSRSVRERIRDLIRTEDRSRPHSDEEISRILEREGIRIARRTVAKYRDHMRIERAQLRRRAGSNFRSPKEGKRRIA